MPRRLALIATSLALVVVLAGCGGDDDSADDRDTTTTTEADASTTTKADDPDTEDSTAPEDTTEPTESTESTPPSSEPPAPFEVPEGADFCAAYAAFEEAFGQVPSDTVENIKAGALVLRDAIAALEPLAPEELADEMPLLVQATETLADDVADVTTQEEAQAALGALFQNEEFSTAAQAVDDYFGENCPQAEDEQAEDGAESPETVTPG